MGLALPPLRSSALPTGILKSAFRLWSDPLFRGSSSRHSNNTKKAAFRRPLVLLERAMGFGPTTSTLARLRSTPELYPHQCNFKNLDFCLNVIQ